MTHVSPAPASSWAARWDHFWRRSGPPHVLALFRIGFGAFLLLYWGLRLPDIALLYSREGILLPLVSPQSVLGPLFLPPPAWAARLILCTLLASLVGLIIGYRARASAAVAFLLCAYYWCLSLYQLGASFDRLFLFLLLVLACSGCDRAFSLAMKLRHGSFWAWEATSVLPQRLIAMQISATYLGVGWQKLLLPQWQSGLVISEGFFGRWATPLAYAVGRWNLPLAVYDALNTVIKGFELLLPFGLWSRRWRPWFMLGGFVFHTMITLLLGIWWFQVLIPAYVVFFGPDETLHFLRRRCPSIPTSPCAPSGGKGPCAC